MQDLLFDPALPLLVLAAKACCRMRASRQQQRRRSGKESASEYRQHAYQALQVHVERRHASFRASEHVRSGGVRSRFSYE